MVVEIPSRFKGRILRLLNYILFKECNRELGITFLLMKKESWIII
jgi:hypothetical protein